MARPDIIILAVDDLPRAAEFYKRGLGFRPVVETPAYVEFAEGVGVYQRDGFGVNVVERPAAAVGLASTELYFRVAELDRASAALIAAGAHPLSPASARPWGETVAYFADPDGNVVALAGRSA